MPRQPLSNVTFIRIFSLLVLCIVGNIAHAGTVSPTSKYAWSNVGGWVNFDPTNGNVQVTSSGLTGYAWSANDGWINLSPTNGGVVNDGNGNLSGFAWDETAGWIDFAGITIDANGNFHGEAVGTNNTINFDCTGCNVVTTWTPTSQNQNTNPTTGSDGGTTGNQIPQTSQNQPPVPPTDVTQNNPDQTQTPDQTQNQNQTETQAQNQPAAAGAASFGGSSSGGGGGGVSGSRIVPTTIQNFTGQTVLATEHFVKQTGTQIRHVARAVKNTSIAVAKVVATPPVLSTGIAIGSIGIIWTLLSTLKNISDLPLLLLRAFQSALPALLFKRKKNSWGTVYDSKTRRPLDPAIVTLIDAAGKEVRTVITDLDGRFGFLAAPGIYSIVAQKSHHTFPAKDIPAIDPIYPQPYSGGPIEVDARGVIVKDIPLDPVEFDWNEYEKYKKGMYKFFSRFDRPLAYLSLILTPIAGVLSCIEVLAAPNPLNITFFIMYLILAILYVSGFSPRIYGTVRDKQGNIIPFAMIKAFWPGSTTTSTHAISDQFGRFYLLLPKGKEFDIQVEARSGKDTYTSIFKRHYSGLHGYFNSNITVQDEVPLSPPTSTTSISAFTQS